MPSYDGDLFAKVPTRSGLYVWTSPPFLRCQRDQGRVPDSPGRPTPNIAPSWNVAPTDPLQHELDRRRQGFRSRRNRLFRHQVSDGLRLEVGPKNRVCSIEPGSIAGIATLEGAAGNT